MLTFSKCTCLSNPETIMRLIIVLSWFSQRKKFGFEPRFFGSWPVFLLLFLRSVLIFYVITFWVSIKNSMHLFKW